LPFYGDPSPGSTTITVRDEISQMELTSCVLVLFSRNARAESAFSGEEWGFIF